MKEDMGISTMSNFDKLFNNILIDKLNVSQDAIMPDAHFTGDLGADSLDMVEIILEFEIAFKIVIPDDEAEGIITVGDAKAFIKKMINE